MISINEMFNFLIIFSMIILISIFLSREFEKNQRIAGIYFEKNEFVNDAIYISTISHMEYTYSNKSIRGRTIDGVLCKEYFCKKPNELIRVSKSYEIKRDGFEKI